MMMRKNWITVTAALIAGVAVGWFFNGKQPVFAGGSTDRHEDFIMATGPVNQALTNSNNNQFLNAELDGVWVLDYKSGKLLATTINRQTGKMISFGEVDLVREFEIAPRANVHFMMSTGTVVKGQSVLYLVETTTGKMGVYSMLANETNTPGSDRILIRRHDMTSLRTSMMPPAANTQSLEQKFPTYSGPPANMPNQYVPLTGSQPQFQQPNLPAQPNMPPQPNNPVQPAGFNNPNK